MVLLSQSHEIKKITTERNAKIPKDSNKCSHQERYSVPGTAPGCTYPSFNLNTRGQYERLLLRLLRAYLGELCDHELWLSHLSSRGVVA